MKLDILFDIHQLVTFVTKLLLGAVEIMIHT